MSLNWTNRPFFFPTVTLLSIPGFIERLCKLATRKVSEATGANFLQELEDWYTWLDNALVLDALMQMATEEPEQSSTGEKKGIYDTASSWLHSRELLIIHLDMFFCFSVVFFLSSPTESSDESSLATSPLRHRLPQSMKIVHEIMYKVEVLYVLCVLLMGRQRNQVLFPTIRAELEFFVWTELNCFFPPCNSSQVHKMLAEFRLIPGLNNLFDKLIWRKYTVSNHVVHGQNENCDCSPVWNFNSVVLNSSLQLHITF